MTQSIHTEIISKAQKIIDDPFRGEGEIRHVLEQLLDTANSLLQKQLDEEVVVDPADSKVNKLQPPWDPESDEEFQKAIEDLNAHPPAVPAKPNAKEIDKVLKEYLDLVNKTPTSSELYKEEELVVDKRTGAKKADGAKNKLELLPFRAIEQVGLVMTFGARKYDAHNWRKGFDWTRLTGSTLRHLFAWLAGEDIDKESGLNHIAHCATNTLFLLELILTETGEDDRYVYRNKRKKE